MLTRKIFSTTSALLIALSFSTAHAAGAKTDDARQTLQDMEMYASDTAQQADQLLQISLVNLLSAETHTAMLVTIKADVNKMGQEIASLEAEHYSLPKWEQQASDKALPLLKETAANAQSAIEFLRDNPNRLWTEDYRNYANTIERDSEQLAKTLRDYLKYAKAHGEEQHLEQNLGMGGN
jgi:hypothetical protein